MIWYLPRFRPVDFNLGMPPAKRPPNPLGGPRIAPTLLEPEEAPPRGDAGPLLPETLPKMRVIAMKNYCNNLTY